MTQLRPDVGPAPQPVTPAILYAHPFSSYSQKTLTAFYERNVPFELRVLAPENDAAIAEKDALWPIGKFPVLQIGSKTIVESSIIIEWLDSQAPGGDRLLPNDPESALEVRMLDRIFDNYVMTPMMAVVFDRLRPETARDPFGVRAAHDALGKALAWLDAHMARREWAAADRFSLADCAAAPALFYAAWVHPLGSHPNVVAYLQRLRSRPSFARCVQDARPSRHLFPGGAPPE